MTIKVAAIIGSNRKGSYNLKLVEYIKKRYSEQLNIQIVSINDVEMFSADIEENPPKGAMEFKMKVRNAEAVLFAVPEYNFSIPGALKNAIDWMSRGGHDLKDKPTFIVGSSMGVLGSVRAQMHLREIISNPTLQPKLLPGNEVYIGAIHTKINEQNEITDQATSDFLDQVVNNFVEFYNKVK
ncbi:NADPH-dependent FMN reductase [Psychrobacillus psychrodurans]|uniref:NAD(P)H-dependent oxidoreductase n=1 Tax=Psychrobacillus psychrodurans TaxID=126157 RepID=A0A9X3L6S4_9BACI|nr:NADPH-dependent FMN reductase [Psychrobacillus psychrodurans]MCZ8532376.1 NAD(P)H-dependent oxidoreductase [Psychrobacillus psychrodurans]